MANKVLPFYPHRQNRDGSFDSICLRCFATVANARNVEELHSYDKEHVCDATSLAHRNESRLAKSLERQLGNRPKPPVLVPRAL